jgi:uncharacterized protein YlxW (UPF0749 family)
MPEDQRQDPEQPTGRSRLVAAMRRPLSRGQLVGAVLLAILGFAAVVQVQSNDEDDQYVGASQADLIQLINSLELATERTERQIADLESTRDSLRDDAEASRTALELADTRAAQLGILAGTLPAVGPGIVVTVDGPTGAVGTEQLLNGIQELRDAGAEAMEINDTVRIVAQTSISDGPGNTVLVDGEELRAPFVIDVIGDPDSLTPAVFIVDGFASKVRQVGGEVDVEESGRVEVTSTRALGQPQYAEPVE